MYVWLWGGGGGLSHTGVCWLRSYVSFPHVVFWFVCVSLSLSLSLSLPLSLSLMRFLFRFLFLLEWEQKVLPQTLQQRHETRMKLQRLLSDPPKTEADVNELQARLRGAERDVERLNHQIAEAQKKAGDDKLAMYRHHSAMVSKKLQQKESDLEDAQRELEEVNREIEALEAKASEMAGPKFMGRDEFKRYASQLREKTNKFKKLKAELNIVRDETVVLNRTLGVRPGPGRVRVCLSRVSAHHAFHRPVFMYFLVCLVFCFLFLCCWMHSRPPSRSCKARTPSWPSFCRSWSRSVASRGTRTHRRRWRR